MYGTPQGDGKYTKSFKMGIQATNNSFQGVVGAHLRGSGVAVDK